MTQYLPGFAKGLFWRLMLAGAFAMALAACGDDGAESAGNGDRGLETASAERAMSERERALLQEGPLGDVWIGSEDAPITIVEYASMTCNHCAAFHQVTYPRLKESHIDTGEVRYVLREFPFDPLATAAFMLARCAGDERYYGFVDVLFERQNAWAFVPDPMTELRAIAKQGGFSDESFDQCLRNEEVLAHVRAVQSRGAEEFGVNSTPTFFINGEKVEGNLPYDEFVEAIDRAAPES